MHKIIIALYVFATSLALITLKLGSKTGAPISFANNKIQLNVTFYSVVGIFLYGLSFFLYMYLISKFDLGYIIPLVTAFVYILIFIASYFIFNEVFTILKVIGIILILCGMVILNLKK